MAYRQRRSANTRSWVQLEEAHGLQMLTVGRNVVGLIVKRHNPIETTKSCNITVRTSFLFFTGQSGAEYKVVVFLSVRHNLSLRAILANLVYISPQKNILDLHAWKIPFQISP